MRDGLRSRETKAEENIMRRMASIFFTARGKDFCRELLADGRVQILGYNEI